MKFGIHFPDADAVSSGNSQDKLEIKMQNTEIFKSANGLAPMSMDSFDNADDASIAKSLPPIIDKESSKKIEENV
jgi:hypothetical protein